MLVKSLVFCSLSLVATYFSIIQAAAVESLRSQFSQEDQSSCQSRPENWFWIQVKRGNIADFNELYGSLDPKSAEGWTEDRRIGSACLETILLYDHFRKTITHKGVQIVGAWFPEPVDLTNFALDQQLRIEESRFEFGVSLANLKGKSIISFDGSKIVGKLNTS